MQLYFNELSELISQVEVEDTTNKETYFIIINNIVDGYIDRIRFDENLSNSEKQYVAENILLKKNYLITILTFGDKFSANTKNSNLKNINKRCGWFCRNRKRIACTISTIATAGICGTTIAVILSGNFGVGVFLGINCEISLRETIRCWRSI